jgi:hypothetical protein
MTDNVIAFRHSATPINPIAQFIRVRSAQRRLADLHAAGWLPARRIVIDASRLIHQKELIDGFRREGAEIVLDPETAELAAPKLFDGHARKAPWAAIADGNRLDPRYFAARSRQQIVGMIARFAVEQGVDTVLTPSHFLADPAFANWFELDCECCTELRLALDREGGSHIAIDYAVIHAHVARPAKDVVERSGVDFGSLQRRLSDYHRRIGKLRDALERIDDERVDGPPECVHVRFAALTRQQPGS